MKLSPVSPFPGHRSTNAAISFAGKYARSPQFKALFREGMGLVEDTAHYLDGPGRAAARRLRSPASLAYSTESMRLTTRLMQIASWLVMCRAVSNGDMSLDQALDHKKRAKLNAISHGARANGFEGLPEEIKALIEACDRLYERVVRLDALLFADDAGDAAHGADPLASQLSRIEAAFALGPFARSA